MSGESSHVQKVKLRTSLDVYNRIMWDNANLQWNADDVIIGYEDRFLGSMEIPMVDYVVGGEIPWHRVYYFRVAGTGSDSGRVLWDRRCRTDLIFGSGESSSVLTLAHPKEKGDKRSMRMQDAARSAAAAAASVETAHAIQNAKQRAAELLAEEIQIRASGDTDKSHSRGNGHGHGSKSHPARVTLSEDHAFLHLKPTYTWNESSASWIAKPRPYYPSSSSSGSGPVSEYILVTFNCLSDQFDDVADRVPPTPLRMEMLARRLEGLCDPGLDPDADAGTQPQGRAEPCVICLQEMTPPMIDALLSDPWIRGLECTIDPESARVTMTQPCCQVVLTRSMPMLSHSHIEFSFLDRKSATLVDLGPDVGLVLNVHLVSNVGGVDRAGLRQKMFMEMAKAVPSDCRLESITVVGDFNAVDGPQSIIAVWPVPVAEWTDVAASLGPTFDSASNPLANVIAPGADPKRIDAICVHKNATYQPAADAGAGACRLVYPAAGDGSVVFSDHSGIAVKMASVNVLGGGSSVVDVDVRIAAPVYKSALAMVPPRRLWEPIQKIRKLHDPAYERWPPHVNLLYGFVESSLHAAAAEVIAPVLQSFEPFEVTVGADGVGVFQHKRSATLYLKIEPVDKIRQIHARLQTLFPVCNETSERGGDNGFTPHLTIAKVKGQVKPELLELARSTFGQTHVQMRFDLKSLVILGRDGFADPFSARQVLHLGGAGAWGAEWIPPVITAKDDGQGQGAKEVDTLVVVLQKLRQLCEDHCGFHFGLKLAGSVAVLGPYSGVDGGKADLDFMCIVQCGDGSIDAVVDRLVAAAGRSGDVKPRRVGRVIRGMVDGVDFDMSVDADTAADADAGADADTDEDAIISIVRNGDGGGGGGGVARLHAYRRALVAVRRWAKRRGVYSNAHGMLNGISLAIMVAKVVEAESQDPDPMQIFHRFFEVYSKSSEPVSLTATPPPTIGHARLPVITPVTGVDAMRRATMSTAKTIRDELARGAATLAPAMLASYVPQFWVEHPLYVFVCPESEGSSGLLALDGVILSLVVALERLQCVHHIRMGVGIRAGGSGARIIGVNGAGAEAEAEIKDVVRGFCRSTSDCVSASHTVVLSSEECHRRYGPF